MTGCGPGEFIPDAYSVDEINLLEQGQYYGHPNAKRAAVDNDSRQCKWRKPDDPSDSTHTAPIVTSQSSTDGIIEYQADHFDGQLRGNLLVCQYKGSLYRIILTPDGLGVVPESNPPIPLVGKTGQQVGKSGLAVTQAPNGNLIEVRLDSNALYYNKPNEAPTTVLQVKAVFPRRGGQAGGNTQSIYGVNFGSQPSVEVGGKRCPVVSASALKITCTLPGGSGTVDVLVSSSAGSYTFKEGYRYVKGV